MYLLKIKPPVVLEAWHGTDKLYHRSSGRHLEMRLTLHLVPRASCRCPCRRSPWESSPRTLISDEVVRNDGDDGDDDDAHGDKHYYYDDDEQEEEE